jgi:diaminopimelate epimerase
MMEERGGARARIETAAGVLTVTAGARGYTVDMGVPRFGWDEIPLSAPADTLALDLELGPLQQPVAVNMGNPHAVFLVDDAEAIPLAELGPELERHPMFPERANIGVVEVQGPRRVRVRVWERGAGLTPACGSGACAALVAAVRRGVAERTAEVAMDGGGLRVVWNEADHVLMTGPALHSFRGRLDPEMLADA